METLTANIKIDGREFLVKQGRNLLETCLALGFNIPHFCYHAAMGSVGACRLCAVKKYKDGNDTRGKIIMSCMEPVKDGLIITTNDPETKIFREAIIEGLMLNHPHDCPVCDEGGECHLQDMTVMTGHAYRKTEFRKRTYVNQDLGPFINHEMNRCIQCYRCVRFYNDYAGGKDLAVFSAHDHVYFGRHREGTLENEFSGNLVEVCPTGVFTDKTLKDHYTRKWDLSNAPSVCVHCSAGCNTIAGERYGSLRRIMNRYNGSVNGYFLCDRGRFGYEFVNDEHRVRKALFRSAKGKPQEAADPEVLMTELKAALSGDRKIIGIGSPRASLESNFALMTLVGKDHFFHGVAENEFNLVKEVLSVLRNTPARSPSLKDIEKADAIFIIGEDLTNTAPMAALAVRKASRNKAEEIAGKAGIPSWNDAAVREIAQDRKSPVFIAATFRTCLDDIAEDIYRAAPLETAALAYEVAEILITEPGSEPSDPPVSELATKIARALKDAESPLIITGTGSGSKDYLEAAANIASALENTGKKTMLSFVVPWCNSMGLGMLDGLSIEKALERSSAGQADTLIVMEDDLYRQAEKERIDALLDKCGKVIVLDHTETGTTLKADLLLPVGTFAESEGTLVSNEGRAQRYYRVFSLETSVMESWRRIRDLAVLAGKDEKVPWNNLDDIVRDMTGSIPGLEPIRKHMPEADFRMLNGKIRRQTMRFSGRTAILANINVSEPKPPEDPDSPLKFSMEGFDETPPSSLVPFYWVPGWNSCQSVNFYLDEPNGSMKGGDPGIRLIEPSPGTEVPGNSQDAIQHHPGPGEWHFLPVQRIFGSEELSSKATAVAKRIPGPFVLVNRKDADKAGLKENENTLVQIADQEIEVKVMTDDAVPQGIAGLPAGFASMPYVSLPAWGSIKNTKSNR